MDPAQAVVAREQEQAAERRAQRARTDEQGPSRPNWCRLSLTLSLIPPKPGQVISVTRGPVSVRVTVCLPRLAMASLAVLVLGPHPWFWHVVQWVRATGGW